jgi:hypothetical protein
MTDLTLIERDIRRILNSHRSMVYQAAAAEKLLQRINGLHTAVADERHRSQFRSDYKALIERAFGQSPSGGTGGKARLAQLFLDHAGNLKEVEAAKEKLDRELGDF